jgi:hypothetical protein
LPAASAKHACGPVRAAHTGLLSTTLTLPSTGPQRQQISV